MRLTGNWHERKLIMGADFIYSTVPKCVITDERLAALRSLIAGISDKRLDDTDRVDEPTERRNLLLAAVEVVRDANRHRASAAYWQEGASYPMWLTGGMTWGDDPTDLWGDFDAINRCGLVWEQLRRWAEADCAPEKQPISSVDDPYLWLQHDEPFGVSDDGRVRLGYKDGCPAVSIDGTIFERDTCPHIDGMCKCYE